MKQKALIFGKQCINKNAFHKNKKPISVDKVDIRRIVLSKKDYMVEKGSFKYFIGHIHVGNAFSIPLCIKRRQINRYVKYFNDNKCLNLLVHDKELLGKYNKIGDTISNLSNKVFDNIPVYDNKFIRTKKKIYNDRINTNFHGNKILEHNECCASFSVIPLDFVVNIDENYYPHVFLEECKYAIKKKKVINSINEELNLDESNDESDNDKANKSDED